MKKHKGLWIAAGILVVAIIIAWIVLAQTKSTAEDAVEDFEKAVDQGDASKVKSLLVADDDDMDVSQKQVQSLIEDIKKHSNYYEPTMTFLEAQAALIDEDEDANALKSGMIASISENKIHRMGDFYVKEDSGGMFSSYKIGVRPYKLTVGSKKPGTKISVAGHTFQTSKNQPSKTYKSMLPGHYNVKGVKKYQYAKVKDAESVELLDDFDLDSEGNDRKDNVQLSVSGTNIRPFARVSGVHLYVNGKDTGKKVKEYDDDPTNRMSTTKVDETFGPVATDGSVKVHGETDYPWGKSESKHIKITSDQIDDDNQIDITPNPFLKGKAKKNIVNKINHFQKQYMKALKKENEDIIKTGTKSVRKDAADEFDFAFDDEHWEGHVLGTRIDLGRVEIDKLHGQYQAKIPVETHVKKKVYGTIGTDDDDPLDNDYEQKIVNLLYDKKKEQWLVNGTDDDDYEATADDDYMTGKQVVESDFNND